MDVKKLLPNDKFDDSNLDKIARLSDADISPIIYDLLAWLQDYNWPIADKVLQILIDRQNLTLPYISDILNGTDLMWKYWIMELLLPELKPDSRLMFKMILLVWLPIRIKMKNGNCRYMPQKVFSVIKTKTGGKLYTSCFCLFKIQIIININTARAG